MNGKNRAEAADKAAVGGTGGVKERIFSIIRKASEDGITDGQGRTLWIDFTPNVVIEKKGDGYVVWLWRDVIAVKILLDNEYNVVGFDVERP